MTTKPGLERSNAPSTHTKRYTEAVLLTSLLLVGCAGLDSTDVSMEEAPIQGGQVENGFPAVGVLSNSCTAELISPNFVLTAAHCVAPSLLFYTGINYDLHVVDLQLMHPTKDLLLGRLATPIFTIAPLPLSPGPAPFGWRPNVGEICTAVGYGIHYDPNTINEKRSCTEQVESSDSTITRVHMVSGIADDGDSGGPLLCDGAIGGVVHNHTDGNYPHHVRENYATIDRQWIHSTVGFSANILVQNVSGQLDLWLMNGGAIGLEQPLGTVSSDWQLKGTGDFNGDGQPDIVWRHTSGQVAIWIMSGSTRMGDVYPGGPDPGHTWAIQDIGDFDGDGLSDILWRDTGGQLAIWFSGDADAIAYPGYNNDAAPVDLSWQVKAVADFDGDGRADILWRHTSGQVAIWYMAGWFRQGEAAPGGPDPSGLRAIEGIGDFDGDQRSDILWRDGGGYLTIWSHGDDTAAHYPSYQSGGGPVSLSWHVDGVGDFNADGHSDILWKDTAGHIAIWFMVQAEFAGEAYPKTVDSSWSIKAVPRALH